MPLIFNFMVGRLGIVSAPIIDLFGRLVESPLHLVQSPPGVSAFGDSPPEVLLFLSEQPRPAAHSEGPMGEGLNNTKFG